MGKKWADEVAESKVKSAFYPQKEADSGEIFIFEVSDTLGHFCSAKRFSLFRTIL
jgi:hypothetical protein